MSLVKSLDLSDTRIVSFATHGVAVAPGSGEPALALAAPASPTLDNDGYLRASDISELKLTRTELVLVAACNSGTTHGELIDEGLTGLTKAFLATGARSVMVSQWEVNSSAAVTLTTSFIKQLASNGPLGRAEALRQSMLTMIGKASSDSADSHTFDAVAVFLGTFCVSRRGGKISLSLTPPDDL